MYSYIYVHTHTRIYRVGSKVKIHQITSWLVLCRARNNPMVPKDRHRHQHQSLVNVIAGSINCGFPKHLTIYGKSPFVGEYTWISSMVKCLGNIIMCKYLSRFKKMVNIIHFYTRMPPPKWCARLAYPGKPAVSPTPRSSCAIQSWRSWKWVKTYGPHMKFNTPNNPNIYPLVICYIAIETMTIEIVDICTFKNAGSFQSYVTNNQKLFQTMKTSTYIQQL